MAEIFMIVVAVLGGDICEVRNMMLNRSLVPGVRVFDGCVGVVCHPLEEDKEDEVTKDENEKD
jgi:hypothetical protein